MRTELASEIHDMNIVWVRFSLMMHEYSNLPEEIAVPVGTIEEVLDWLIEAYPAEAGFFKYQNGLFMGSTPLSYGVESVTALERLPRPLPVGTVLSFCPFERIN